MEMLPLGTLAVLGIKFILVLPENTLAMLIYKRIEKHLEKIQFEEYSSRVTVYLSTGIKYLAIKMIKLAQKMVIYISSHEIEQVEQTILDLIKAIEYKKAAVQVRNEVGRSTYRRQFSKSDSLNESVDSIDENQLAAPTNDRPPESPRPGFRKTEIGERMSKILIDLDEEKDYKIKAKEMIVKPNREANQKAIYEEVNVEFQPKSREIIFINKHGAVQKDTLH